MKTFLLSVAIFFSVAATAETNFYIEPYLGYHANASFGFPTSVTASGLTYGARAGGDFMSIIFGLDYMTGSWSDNGNPKDSITPGNLGLFAGYVFPMFLKVYGTYFFDEKYKFSNSNASDNYGGTEIKLGVGYTALPFITLNLEYAFGKLTKDNGNAMNSDASVSYFGLVVGLPLEF
jgi:hypothetical protein